ncbi:hypothetical protein K458DRAFT_27426 [Lentithecium fluviatile CBS 122367]|uniref:Telomerase reverse transcriptase n=1 Tax=Lentithecium fluviatile CBS 122367 TaxID=1168545 RepID=A0A6G1J3P7_9PLEO|nr:hypothetical protein K458DRAFT_27426 [Lentithecium fluviatile CBS 122367]
MSLRPHEEKRSAHVGGRTPKRARDAADQSAPATTPGVEHPVLSRLYPHVASLRHYLLSQLPSSSKNRRRKLTQLGLQHQSQDATAPRGIDIELGELLDSTLVGVVPKAADEVARKEAARERDRDLESFSQQLPPGTTASTSKPGYLPQSEIVDFVIWRLFKRSTFHKPSHLLCHGFQRSGTHGRPGPQQLNHCIPGLLSHHRNPGVDTLKGPLWCRLHALLGPGGDLMMMDMLLDCGIFTPVEGSRGNYLQVPTIAPKESSTSKKPHTLVGENRKPSAIRFVRSRMLYARAAVNAKGGVRFGMRHIRTRYTY